MTNQNSQSDQEKMPEYSIAELMALLKIDEPAVRKLLTKAGVEVDRSKTDPGETIRYDDFRKLWISRANKREGRLLATLLVEESGNWWTRMTGNK